MIQFNAKNGLVMHKATVLDNSNILSHITHKVVLEPGTEKDFTLQSLKSLLEQYPILQQLAGRSKRFLEQFEEEPNAERFYSIDSMILRRHTYVQINELTLASTEIVRTKQKDKNKGLVNSNFVTTYEAMPSTKVDTGVYLSGKKDDEKDSFSLMGFPISEVKDLPIIIGADEIAVTHDFANAEKNDIDYSQHQREEYLQKDHTITLLELIETILIEVYLP